MKNNYRDSRRKKPSNYPDKCDLLQMFIFNVTQLIITINIGTGTIKFS